MKKRPLNAKKCYFCREPMTDPVVCTGIGWSALAHADCISDIKARGEANKSELQAEARKYHLDRLKNLSKK